MNLVWKAVCQSYGDKGRMHQNWGAQIVHGHTDPRRVEHGENKQVYLRCPPGLLHASVCMSSVFTCCYLMAQKLTCRGSKLTQCDFSGILTLFSYLPFPSKPIHVTETYQNRTHWEGNGCVSTQH